MNVCWSIVGERISTRLRSKYFAALLKQEPGYFDSHQSGELVSHLSADITLIKEGTSEKVAVGISIFSQVVGGLIIAFVKGWKMTLVMLATSPLLVFVGGLHAWYEGRKAMQLQKSAGKYNDLAQESISGIKTVYSFNAQNSIAAKFDYSLNILYKSGVKRAHIGSLASGVAMFIIFGVYSLGFWYGGKLVVDGEMEAGDVLAVFFSVMIAAMGVGQSSQVTPNIAKAKGAAFNILEVIKRTPLIDTKEGEGITLDKMEGTITFKNVTFSYPSRPDVDVIDKMSFKVQKGQMVAFVGASGSGKSTVINLIERFYEQKSGKIKIDGINIEDYDLIWLRSNIALVSQEPILFSGTIRENIEWGKPGASFKEIKKAAKKANAYGFIKDLKDGFDTEVGEKGTQLSGGQKQRIAIARAVLKDPTILLLDEATSALDAESEHLVQEALDKLMKNRTTIVVAHRLTTIRDADKIFVVQKGKVVEEGSHNELVKIENGVYKALVERQLEKV